MRRRQVLAPLGFALLLAAGSACTYKKSDFSPTPSELGSIIQLTSVGAVTTLPADGLSRLRLEARLLGAPALDRRDVVFSTSNGMLDGGEPVENCTGCRKVTADASGVATVDLVASQRVGTAVVSAAPASERGIVANFTVQFVAAAPDSVLRFVVAPARAPADGATLSTFTVEVSPSVAAGTMVRFDTTNGSFQPGKTTPKDAPVGADHRASADLESPRAIGTARVTAIVNNVARDVRIDFERALPDDLTAAVDNATATAALDTKIRVTATLRRDLGKVTDGTTISLQAKRPGSTAQVGVFTNIGVTTDGVATADFLPQTTQPGLITLTVTAPDNGVTGTVDVLLTQ